MKKQIGTIDCTPSWQAAMRICIAGMEDGNNESKKIAKEEMMRCAEIAQMYVDRSNLIKDINGTQIREGEKFKFKFMRDLHDDIELTGSFSWNDIELRYEIDIWDNTDYTCLSYISNGTMHAFELLPEGIKSNESEDVVKSVKDDSKMPNPAIDFAYFAANFPPDFIEKVWSDEPHIAQHLKEKLHRYAENETFISVGTFMKWFFDLDMGNQHKLTDWIQNNYK
ncbi:MAG: hypothetical protein PHW73_00040 [Atribacterota bacterium]|nr:hypothetical protein [Atribacterota bacterium]